jgi:hypothetical protein
MLKVMRKLRNNLAVWSDVCFSCEDKNGSRAAAWIRGLVPGLPPSQGNRRRFIVLQIFIDDSGRGQEYESALVLAGFIAPFRNWEAFALTRPAKMRRPAVEVSAWCGRLVPVFPAFIALNRLN